MSSEMSYELLKLINKSKTKSMNVLPTRRKEKFSMSKFIEAEQDKVLLLPKKEIKKSRNIQKAEKILNKGKTLAISKKKISKIQLTKAKSTKNAIKLKSQLKKKMQLAPSVLNAILNNRR